jgi:hypothetical protein
MTTLIKHETALAAMAIWEDIQSRLIGDADNEYARKQQEIGASELRSLCLEKLAPAAEIAYGEISDSYHEPFDWEFVPAFLSLAEPILADLPDWDISIKHAKDLGGRVLTYSTDKLSC